MPPAKETIVVIDDEPEVRSLIEDMLRGLGYTVLATGDPQAALQFARTHPDPIHLLLTDVVSKPLFAAESSQEGLGVTSAHAHLVCYRAWLLESIRIRQSDDQSSAEPADGP